MKKKVLIIFGGKSGEHAVSVMSALSIEQYIDRQKFEPLFLGISEQGKWNLGEKISEITDGKKVITSDKQIHLPSSQKDLAIEVIEENKQVNQIGIDVVFPVIHGTNGEDGRLQGFLEMANLPYVGSGVLGSALAMDKVVQKLICLQAQIPVPLFEWCTHTQWQADPQAIQDRIAKKLSYPLFIKPANLGSSVGISKVKSSDELMQAINEAFRYDNKIIIEQAINNIKEIEIGVLGNEQPIASVCAEIIPHSEFYDYQTKYVTDDIESKIPAEIPQEVSQRITKLALKTFSILSCKGLARADFFFQPDSGEVFLNEINTMPGFTKISMYPKMWQASGVEYSELISELIELGIEDWEQKQQLEYSYK